MSTGFESKVSDLFSPTKWAFTTRRVSRKDAVRLLPDAQAASAGDLLLAEVETLGQHKKLQLSTGRFSDLYLGDRVVVACGARYAPDQFEAEAVIGAETCDLVAGGGIAGRMRLAHAKMAAPTRLKPVARLGRADGQAVNLADYAMADKAVFGSRPSVIAVVGSSMNSGKTTTAVNLARGLSLSGLKVGGAKITGTGAFGDVNAFLDAGIDNILDFTDAGLASTYQVPIAKLESVAATLLAHHHAAGCEAVVVELADGVFQQETAALLRSEVLASLVDGVLFAAADALGAVTGARAVSETGLKLVGLSGLLSCSPLACREASRAIGARCFTREELSDPQIATAIVCAAIEPGLGSAEMAAAA